MPIAIALPKQEGVYDLVLTADHTSMLHLPQSSRLPLNWNKPLAQRRIQVVVLAGKSPPAASQTPAPQREVEIDPANPRWWERFSKLPHGRRLRNLGKGPLGNDRLRPASHPLGELVQLAPAASPGDVSWEAYLLSIEEPGQPYVLEVDYPSDVPQTMGISIIEPNAAGAVLPIGLDSGVDQADEVVAAAGPPKMLHHRVIFWPRTKTPVVLITNRRDRAPAVYGKIRALRIGPRLPRAFPAGGPRPERLLAAYLDRPLFPENFSATQTPGPMSDVGVDDWLTFYEGGTRLVDYLNHVGYNGLVVAALADGSTIYPSEVLGADAALRYGPVPRNRTGPGSQGRAGDAPAALRPRGAATHSCPGVRRPPARAGGPVATRRAGDRGDRMGRARRADLAGDVSAGAGAGAVLQRAPPASPAGHAGGGPRAGRRLRPAPVVRWTGDPACAPTAMPSFPVPTGAWTTSPSPASSRNANPRNGHGYGWRGRRG